MKIGIISEFLTNTVNFGNQLQAYALNYFLRKTLCVDDVRSIVLSEKQLGKHTDVFSLSFCKKMFFSIKRRLSPQPRCEHVLPEICADRLSRFQDFRIKNIPMHPVKIEKKDVSGLEYDIIIVGSDVVWAQSPLWISRTKFLDFSTQKPFKRVSYAASFGQDYIPKENIRYIKKYLRRFDAISVRENSSVAMLNKIGVQNVSYCVDPTLLLTASDWGQLEEVPDNIDKDKPFIFTYLLGNETQQRSEIMNFAEEKNLSVITVPNADGKYTVEDEDFGHIRLSGCSIENWIWLIHHAEYIFTDSFHGTVFSTIFQKRFIVLRRTTGTVDINNRMLDFLREIGQEDKALSIDAIANAAQLNWDYEEINAAIKTRRENSINFLKNAIGENHA